MLIYASRPLQEWAGPAPLQTCIQDVRTIRQSQALTPQAITPDAPWRRALDCIAQQLELERGNGLVSDATLLAAGFQCESAAERRCQALVAERSYSLTFTSFADRSYRSIWQCDESSRGTLSLEVKEIWVSLRLDTDNQYVTDRVAEEPLRLYRHPVSGRC